MVKLIITTELQSSIAGSMTQMNAPQWTLQDEAFYFIAMELRFTGVKKSRTEGSVLKT